MIQTCDTICPFQVFTETSSKIQNDLIGAFFECDCETIPAKIGNTPFKTVLLDET